MVMSVKSTALAGVFVIDVEPVEDERGLFARTFCSDVFSRGGLDDKVMQSSISFNPKQGTLRGMHFQKPPHAECKLVRCTSGRIFDVVLDLRKGSETYCGWIGEELSSENRRSLYIPKGCAHGFLTLSDNSEVLYQISEPYAPESASGVRWNDPAFGVEWPFSPSFISRKDLSFPDLVP